MGMLKRQKEEKKAKAKGGRRFGISREDQVASDWGKVDQAVVHRAIVAAARAGGALRFGYTADGGAFALGIYGDGDEPYTEYFRPNEDVAFALTEIAQMFYDRFAEADAGTV